MGKLIVVENDRVEGTDEHNVSGTGPVLGNPTASYSGIGDFDYAGKMTDQLSDFVKIDGTPVALKNSKSSLNPGEDIPPTGKHFGPNGKKFESGPDSIAPIPTAITLSITEPVGEGNPSSKSGSSFVKVDGTEILLDGDKIDTCDGLGGTGNSTVTAENQVFVSCSE